MLTTRHLPSLTSNRRASAIIGSLVMVAILAMAVGVMLSTSNQTIRVSRDKIMYEEAYQAAISGTHIARAWLIDPELAVDHTGAGASLETGLEKIIANADKMGRDIKENYSLADLSPSQVSSKWFSDMGKQTLSDGSVVLFDGFPKSKSGTVAGLNYSDSTSFDNSLYHSGNEKPKTYVADLRITTLPTSESGAGALRRASFVIESKGVSEYAGTKKERVVKQRVLVYPKDVDNPLLGANEALIINGNYAFGGSSHALVRWAPAIAAGDIKILNLSLSYDDVTKKIALNAGNKSVVGRGMIDDGQLKGEVDYWVKWMAGTEGTLLTGAGTTLFDPLPNGQNVVDLFKELYTTGIGGLDESSLVLQGNYQQTDGTIADGKGLFDMDEAQIDFGSLVQGSDAVDKRIENFFNNDVDPALLKEIAIENGTYIKWSTADNAYVNSENQVLYFDSTGGMSPYGHKNNKVTSLSNISMAKMLPKKNDTVAVHAKDTLPDKLLYVDAPGRSEDVSSMFWKGILYANCNLTGSGSSGSVSVYAKDPDQYAADPYDESKLHKELDNVIMDGILIANGQVNVGGNLVIYGTLATTENVTLNGTPSVFYNSANSKGRMSKPVEDPQDSRLIGSRLSEEKQWSLVTGSITE